MMAKVVQVIKLLAPEECKSISSIEHTPSLQIYLAAGKKQTQTRPWFVGPILITIESSHKVAWVSSFGVHERKPTAWNKHCCDFGALRY